MQWWKNYQKECLLQVAEHKSRKGTQHESKTAEELEDSSAHFLAAQYQKKGRKQRQAELLPELKEAVEKGRKEAEQGIIWPDQSVPDYGDELEKRASEQELWVLS